MTDELAAFLRARLDEDEQEALAAAGAPWDASVPNMVHVSATAQRENRALRTQGYVASTECPEYQHHIARHDPARVLAEVEAKRDIVKLCEPPLIDVTGHGPVEGRDYIPGEGPGWGLPVLKRLAAVYADHPDYRQAWAG